VKDPFILTDHEVEALYLYFYSAAGYVSYEHHPFIIVLIKRLREHVDKKDDE